MIPVRSVLLARILRSTWAVSALALLIASLLEWGMIAEATS
jgi:hypothetical protein